MTKLVWSLLLTRILKKTMRTSLSGIFEKGTENFVLYDEQFENEMKGLPVSDELIVRNS